MSPTPTQVIEKFGHKSTDDDDTLPLTLLSAGAHVRYQMSRIERLLMGPKSDVGCQDTDYTKLRTAVLLLRDLQREVDDMKVYFEDELCRRADPETSA